MNVSENATKPSENNPISLRELPEEMQLRGQVEPCEFENLLQRAVEILSIRARSATVPSS